MDEAPKKIFIFGVGYVGKHLAKSLIRAGHFVLGTSSEKHEGISSFDLRDPGTHKDIITKIELCDSVVVTIPPVKGKDIVQPILNKHGVKPKQVIYCSSTGVYKNTDGNYVDELGEICFESNLSRARFEAEQSWLQNFHAVRLRIAGIYGPNRNLISSFMRAPIKIVSGKENHFFNRVHVQDIIEIIHKIIDLKIVNEVINVADDCPTSMQEVLDFIFKEMALDKEKYVEEVAFSEISKMMQHFYSSNKKVLNQKSKALLNYKFQYPSYKEGYRNIIEKKQYIL